MAKIMVVDDEKDVVWVLNKILVEEGHEVTVCYSGEEALEVIEEDRPDVVLLDIMMPGIDGYETLYRIRENVKIASIPVVIVSAKIDEGSIVKGLEMGANDYFTKPYNPTILKVKIESILKFKEMDDQLKEYSEELEQKVKERTIELEASNKLKDLFTDIMRHDLLNPAGLINNFSNFLLKEKDEDKIREMLIMNKQSSEKLIEMIQSASSYAKISEKREIDLKVDDLNIHLKEAVKNFKYKLREADMEVVFDSEGEYQAMVNPLIENVFSNLLSNAIKYAPDGKKVEIDIIDRDDTWTISFKDWGAGIKDEHKDKLFSRFERLGKEGVKGSGLGMAITKMIMDLHGGKIWVEDNTCEYSGEQGRTLTKVCGSIFYISLPKK